MPSHPTPLPYGLAPNGRLVPVAEAARGGACGLACPACGGPLVARKGTERRHHLAHATNAPCPGALETMLHRLGKQIIAEMRLLVIPAISPRLRDWRRPRPIVASHVEVEPVLAGGFRPDLLLHAHPRDGGRPLAVEILVSHPCSAEKIAAYRAAGLSVVEVDLSAWRRREIPARFDQEVIGRAPRRWLWNHHVEADRAREEAWEREETARVRAAGERWDRSPAGRRWAEWERRRREAIRAREADRKARGETFDAEVRAIIAAHRAKRGDGA